MRFSSVIVARAQSPAALPKPGPEVKELVFMVGKFTNEGAVKAGAMGAELTSDAKSGTDECRWAAGGFWPDLHLRLRRWRHEMGRNRPFLLRFDFQEIPISCNQQFGRDRGPDRHGKRRHVDLEWRELCWRKSLPRPVGHRRLLGRTPMNTPSRGARARTRWSPYEREGHSCRDLEARDIKTGAVTRCFTHDLRLTRNPTDLRYSPRDTTLAFDPPRRSLSASPGSTFPAPATDAPASRDRTSGSMLRRTCQSPLDPTLRSAAG